MNGEMDEGSDLGPFKRWLLVSYRDGQGRMSLCIPGKVAELLFLNEGRLAGSGGCNRLMASYTRMGQRLKIGPVASTLMYCGDPPELMSQEADYFRCLSASDRYQLEGEVLLMFDKEGSLILRFKQDEDFP